MRETFPDARIGHDYFHTAKLLNEGLQKEMRRLRRKAFTIPIQEYHEARGASLSAVKSGLLPNLKCSELNLIKAWNFYHELHKLGSIAHYGKFLQMWEQLKHNKQTKIWGFSIQFFELVENCLPNRGFTKKNYRKYWKEACNIWRRIIRDQRIPFEVNKKGYTKACYVVLMNPRNMAQNDKLFLRKSLKQFPFLRDIRKYVTKFHNQFNVSENNLRSLSFLQNLIKKDTHKKLKSAVHTLIEAEARIFAFRDVLRDHPEIKSRSSIRTNREELNKKIGRVARNQYGLRSTPGACARIGGILDCPMIITKSLRKKELADL